MDDVHKTAAFFGAFIGAVTLTGMKRGGGGVSGIVHVPNCIPCLSAETRWLPWRFA